MQSRVLEHQQLAVCLLREQELWEREGDDEQELEGSQGTHSSRVPGQGLQHQPIAQWKGQRPKVTGGLELGLAVQSPSMSEDSGQSEEEALGTQIPEAHGERGLEAESPGSQGRRIGGRKD